MKEGEVGVHGVVIRSERGEIKIYRERVREREREKEIEIDREREREREGRIL